MARDMYDRPDGLVETQTIMREQIREHLKGHAAVTRSMSLRWTNLLVAAGIVANIIVAIMAGHHG